MTSDLKIEEAKFYDDGKWRENVYVFKERFIQCEITCRNGKYALFHGNEMGFNYFMEEIRKLDLKSILTHEKFIFNQDIDSKRAFHGRGFVDKLYDWEEDDQEFGYPNMNGYREKTFGRDEQSRVANRVEIYWYPEEKRIMAASIDYDTWSLKLHLSPQGLDSFLNVLNMANNLYYDLQIFCPSQEFEKRNGLSLYSLTDLPAFFPNEEHALFLGFRKEKVNGIDFYFTTPKIYDPDHSYLNAAAFYGNSEGWLQMEAILHSCLERFQDFDFVDFDVNHITSKTLPEYYHYKSARCKIRYVFLKNENPRRSFSVEYDPEKDILYFYLNLKQLVSLCEETRLYIMGSYAKEYKCPPDWRISEKYEYNFMTGGNQSLDATQYGPLYFHKFEKYIPTSPLAYRFLKHNKELFEKYKNNEFTECSWKKTIKNQDHRILIHEPRYFIY